MLLDANYRILITHGVVEGLAYSELGGNDVPIPKSALSQFDSPYWTHSQCSNDKG